MSGRRAGRRLDGDHGAFAVLELAILMPFVIVCLLIVVAFGRVNRGRQLVDQASQAASRAGSLASTPGMAQTSAQSAAESTLVAAGMSCQAVTVLLDTSHWYAGGEVVARVTCTSNLSGLALAGVPGTVSLTSSSTSVLERYRQIDLGFSFTDGPSVANRRAGVPHEAI